MTARSRVPGDLARLALAAVVGTLVLAAYATARIWAEGARDDVRQAGAIVVLGAAQFNGHPSDVFAARLDHAVALYLSGIAPYLVVTGGKEPGDRTTEAATARQYAIDRGVPASAILGEDVGRTTLESIRWVAAILRRHGVADAVFVSDRTHMLRVLRMATDQGISAYGSPTSTSPRDLGLGRRIDATIHELGGLALYFLAEQDIPSDPGLPTSGSSAATGEPQSLAAPLVRPSATPGP